MRQSYRDLLTASKVLLAFTLSWLKDPVVYQLCSQYTPVINGNILLSLIGTRLPETSAVYLLPTLKLLVWCCQLANECLLDFLLNKQKLEMDRKITFIKTSNMSVWNKSM